MKKTLVIICSVLLINNGLLLLAEKIHAPTNEKIMKAALAACEGAKTLDGERMYCFYATIFLECEKQNAFNLPICKRFIKN